MTDPTDVVDEVARRLGSLAEEIQRLEGDRLVFAKAHRIKVAQSAYDAVLGEACRLAGVQPVEIEIPGRGDRGVRELPVLAVAGVQ